MIRYPRLSGQPGHDCLRLPPWSAGAFLMRVHRRPAVPGARDGRLQEGRRIDCLCVCVHVQYFGTY